MSNQPSRSLAELTDKIGSGATPRGGERSYKNQGIPLIRSMNVYDLRFEREGLAFLDQEQAAELNHVTVREGDVLVNITGASVARCCTVPHDLAGARVNQHVAIIRPKSGLLDGRFLSYVLVSHDYKALLLNLARVGGTREALTKGGLERFKVPCPTFEQQLRVASIVSAYDDLINVNRRRIALLEETTERLFEEWFVRLRFPGYEGHPIVETPYGLVPEEWSFVSLGHLCERITDGAHISPPSVETGMMMASVKDMRDWDFDLSECRRISEDDFNELVRSDCKPRVGDVLIAKDGANLNKHTFIVWRELPLVLLSSIAILRPPEDFEREYLVSFLKSDCTSSAIKQMRSGAAIPRIVLRDFKRLQVLMPPRELRQHFECVARPIHDLIRRLNLANGQLTNSRDLMLPRLLSGQLALSTAERELEAVA